MRGIAACIAAALLLSGCNRGNEDGPVVVSVIGAAPAIVDPSRKPIDAPTAALLAATAQGLVRFDAAGQIEPGLALRWAVSDDGLYYTFRLDADRGLDAENVAQRLRAAIGRNSRNPLKPQFGAIAEIVAVTPEVVEIRLARAQDGLLTLLARPEMALIAGGAGTGPLEIAIRFPHSLLLSPVADPDAEDVSETERQRREIRLRGERAGRAVARFAGGEAGLVIGGGIGDLPIAQAAKMPARLLRLDPVSGLFGFEVIAREGFVRTIETRRALAMAIDREAIGSALAIPNWRPVTGIVPAGLPDPARPDWSDTDIETRRRLARAAIVAWQAHNPGRPAVRIAAPKGYGVRMLVAMIARDWSRIGVGVERVPIDAAADLRLIDEVAPADGADWYLRRFACDRSLICSAFADAALTDGRLNEADRRLADAVPFIPIAQPVRWSLVAQGLAAYQDNVRNVHPLIHLRAGRR